MSFHVGQKVECVDASDAQPCIRKNAIYEVTCVKPSGCLRITCCSTHQRPSAGWFAHRFRPIVENKTDISFAHEILRKVTRKDRVKA